MFIKRKIITKRKEHFIVQRKWTKVFKTLHRKLKNKHKKPSGAPKWQNSRITKIPNFEGNLKRKVPNQMAKSKVQTHQTNRQ